MTDPLMAKVEMARRYEVVSDGMQVARLLERFLRMRNTVGGRGDMSRLALRKTVTFLGQVPLFRNLSKGQLQSLARSMARRRFAAGEEMVRQGKGGVALFVVVSGKAEAVHTRVDGTQVVVNTFGPTDFFGELAMLHNQPRTASVVALEDTECLVLVQWEFMGKLRQYKGMATAILQEQSRRFQRAMAVL